MTRKPTGPARILEEYDEYGRHRVCIATRTDGHSGHWQLQETHPSGVVFTDSLKNASEAEVPHYMANMMARNRHEFIRARDRGDKPVYVPNATAAPAESVTTLMPNVRG